MIPVTKFIHLLVLQRDITEMSVKLDKYEPSGSWSYFLNADFEDNFMIMKYICILLTWLWGQAWLVHRWQSPPRHPTWKHHTKRYFPSAFCKNHIQLRLWKCCALPSGWLWVWVSGFEGEKNWPRSKHLLLIWVAKRPHEGRPQGCHCASNWSRWHWIFFHFRPKSIG